MRTCLCGLVFLCCASTLGSGESPSPTAAIKVDQVGYLPAAPKIAMVTDRNAAGTFVVRRIGNGEVVFRGTLSAPVADASSGDRVQAAVFTDLTQEGRYSLEVPGVGVSWPFAIAPDAYSRAFYLAMRSFYGQRCGTAVDLGPEFPGFAHDVCHTSNAYHATSGKGGAKASGNRGRQDPAMKALPDLPPAKMYLDDQESYASNEVAINWNAPLVFLLAGQLPKK